MRGKIIEFEGLDFSFKETNSKRLYEYIKENITEKVILVSFPNYKSEICSGVKSYLNGEYGSVDEIDAYQSALLYTVDRFDTVRKMNFKQLLEDGYYIVLDRYMGSNMIFQGTKLNNLSQQIDFFDWLKDLEYNKLDLPIPNIVLYMDMPVRISHKLIQKRDNKIGGSELDIHESNYKFKMAVEANAMIVIHLEKWDVIDTVNIDNTIKTEDEIFNNILNVLKDKQIIPE